MSASPSVDMAEVDLINTNAERLAPFLRWAGGKRWLVPQILDLVGAHTVERYHEPFLGGASVFLALNISEKSFLSDLNADLIEVYSQVRDNPSDVADRISKYENTSEAYYAARSEAPKEALQRAARFIFLNHTSYNGIFRVNLKGQYNVPFGNRKSPKVPDEDALTRISKRLHGTELRSRDFENALEEVQENDLVFMDPPYTVAHNSNGFIKYNQHLFSFDDQERLARSIKTISDKGARFILTNAAHASIDKLFSPLGEKHVVSRGNSIGGKQASRGKVEEYVFTNLGVM